MDGCPLAPTLNTSRAKNHLHKKLRGKKEYAGGDSTCALNCMEKRAEKMGMFKIEREGLRASEEQTLIRVRLEKKVRRQSLSHSFLFDPVDECGKKMPFSLKCHLEVGGVQCFLRITDAASQLSFFLL